MNKLILIIFSLTLSCATANIQFADYKKQAYFSTGMLNVDAKLTTGKNGGFTGTVFAIDKQHLLTARTCLRCLGGFNA